MGRFQLEFIRVSHSIVDGVGLAIRTPLGVMVHTGDFKISHTTMDGMADGCEPLRPIGEKGVLALLSDSTNVEKEGYTISAQEIGATLVQNHRRAQRAHYHGPVCFQHRQNPADRQYCPSAGRKMVFNGRSIEVSVDIAKEAGLSELPRGMEIDIDEIEHLPGR